MTLSVFILISLALLGLCVWVILRTLLKVDDKKNRDLESEREADNVKHFKKQLAELEKHASNGDISTEEYQQYKLEAERRLLSCTKEKNTKQQTNTPLAFIITICMALPLSAALLYIALGQPTILNGQVPTENIVERKAPRTLDETIASIKAQLQKDPNDLEAKFSLGRIYYASEQFTLARDVFAEVFQQQPDRPDVLLSYAEAIARTQDNFFKGQPLQLIQRVLQLDPNNKKANWILGIAAFQENNTQGALSIWQRQLARNDNSPQEKQMLERMITQAGGSVEKNTNDDSAHLTITASISDTLKGQYKPSDSVFIYAKAASGPAMPLAIYRTTADKLPLTLTLSDADAMTPQMKLSMFQDIIAIARISKTGDAITKSGDLQGQSPVLKNNNQKLSIEINSVIP